MQHQRYPNRHNDDNEDTLHNHAEHTACPSSTIGKDDGDILLPVRWPHFSFWSDVKLLVTTMFPLFPCLLWVTGTIGGYVCNPISRPFGPIRIHWETLQAVTRIFQNTLSVIATAILLSFLLFSQLMIPNSKLISSIQGLPLSSLGYGHTSGSGVMSNLR